MQASGATGILACACVLTSAFNVACDKESDRTSDTGTDNSDVSAETEIPCDDFVACTIDECDPDTGLPINTPDDSLCDDDLFCNGVETCNALAGCQPGDPIVVSDSIECTTDYCDEETDSVVHVAQDGICDDDVYCNGTETCDDELGCQDGVSPVVDDGFDCTVESCDEERDMVVVTVSDATCDDSEPCNGAETCDLALGCVDGTALDDGETCGLDRICLSGVCDDSICGDGFVDPLIGEQCEDGNVEPLDGCDGCFISPDCDLTDTITLNDTALTDSATGTLATTDSSIYYGECGGYSGYEHLYELNVESPMKSLNLTTTTTDFEPVTYLRGGPGACDAEELLCDFGANSAQIDTRCLDVGYYYGFVDGGSVTDLGGYTLDITATPLIEASRQVTLSSASPTYGGGGDFGSTPPSSTESLYCLAEGQEDAWEVTLTDPMVSVAARMREGSVGLALHARTLACDMWSELDCDEGFGSVAIGTGCLDPGTYYIFADTNIVTPGWNYMLDIEGLTRASAVGSRVVSLDATTTTHTTSGMTDAGMSHFDSTCGGSGPEQIWEITLGTDVEQLQVDVAAGTWNPVLQLRRDLCDECEVHCADAWMFSSTLWTSCLPAGTYYLVVDGATGLDNGDYDLDITATPVTTGRTCNPSWEIHQSVTLDGVVTSLVIDDATSSTVIGSRGAFCAESSPDAEEHIYELHVDEEFSQIEISTAFSSFDTVLSVYHDLCDEWEWECIDDYYPIAPHSLISMDCPSVGSYYVIVDGVDSTDVGPYHLEITGTPLAPGEVCER